MAWIEAHQSLGQHPKLLRLAKKLCISDAAAVGHLQYIWWWALDYAPDGNISKMASDEIAIAGHWDGDHTAFEAALIFCNWIDADRKLHDWAHYAGPCLMAKDRQKKYRDKRLGLRYGHVTNTVETTVEAMTTIPNLTIPNLTIPNLTIPNLTNKEKRFQRPSPQEVNDYGKLIGYNGVNGEQFCDFYESKGWVVGKSPMKDWKAALRLWKKRGGFSFGKTGRGIETGEGRVGYVAGGFVPTKKPLF